MNGRLLIILAVLILSGGCAMIQRQESVSGERNILWLDGTANFERLGTEEGIIRVFDKAKSIGITDLVLCVRISAGYVLYESEYVPQLKEWRDFQRADDFDFVNTALHHARKRGMKLHLSFNMFSAGDKNRGVGVIYEGREDWQTILYTPEGFLPATEYTPGYAVFTNPALPEVQEYLLKILQEAAEKYHPEGIILDRCRYTTIHSDFSDFSRKQFEKYLAETRGKTGPLANWPEDILTWEEENGSPVHRPGPYFKEWLEWRAWIIRQFAEKARKTVKDVDAGIEYANYVGAWYPVYYELGVNWASRSYDPSADYEWATKEYKKTGFAEIFDWLMVGTYFYEVNIEELKADEIAGSRTEDAMGEGREYWYSVEGSAQVAMEVIRGAVPVYGSLYVAQYEEHENPRQFQKAVEMVRRITDGVMVFDLVHLEQFGYWDAYEAGLKAKVK